MLGTQPTRVSWSLISFGTPLIIPQLPCFWDLMRVRNESHAIRQFGSRGGEGSGTGETVVEGSTGGGVATDTLPAVDPSCLAPKPNQIRLRELILPSGAIF